MTSGQTQATKPGVPVLMVGKARKRLLSQFYVAFALMSVIPLLICCYLITVKFFTLSILEGLNGVYFLLAVVFSILGLLIGQLLLRNVVKQLVTSNERLEKFHEMQSAFVHNVAHELRSPLTIIKGALDNLSDGVHGRLTAEQSEPLSMSLRETARLKRIVADLLDVAQVEAGKLRLVREPMSLQDCLASVAQSCEGLAKDRGLRIAMDVPPTPVTITGDRDRLNQVFINLVVNAIKFTERGEIRLRLTDHGENAQVEVADTGPGIPVEDLKRIFDKFERIGPSNLDGSGLGLPIARGIVELHHGRLWAESSLGEGSRFFVTLPHHA
ncbi:MAG: HAMP domain-containing sensor histidine kinase [Candidatus Omnitrophota bacterium]|nr:HAMP domain-containing sensor histidine kinase [Candidatus Omnitrophota bacterium]